MATGVNASDSFDTAPDSVDKARVGVKGSDSVDTARVGVKGSALVDTACVPGDTLDVTLFGMADVVADTVE